VTTSTDLQSGPIVDYGARLRLGVIVPSGNAVAEPEIAAMLSPGVRAYITRLPLTGSSPAELTAMLADVDRAADLLADMSPDLIAFHCTAVTTAAPDLGRAIQEKIQDRTRIPAITTSEALLAALRALEARRIVLLTPYVESVHTAETAFLKANGVGVIADAFLGIDSNAEMGRLDPGVLYDFVLEHRTDDADAYLVSCTAIRSAPLIAPLEDALGRAVLTSNQAMIWHAQRSAGVEDSVEGFGRLLSR
jgi:maleate isomerase